MRNDLHFLREWIWPARDPPVSHCFPNCSEYNQAKRQPPDRPSPSPREPSNYRKLRPLLWSVLSNHEAQFGSKPPATPKPIRIRPVEGINLYGLARQTDDRPDSNAARELHLSTVFDPFFHRTWVKKIRRAVKKNTYADSFAGVKAAKGWWTMYFHGHTWSVLL